MMFWTLAGLVIMGLVTGVIASGMTITDIDEEIKLYGTVVSLFNLRLSNVITDLPPLLAPRSALKRTSKWEDLTAWQ